MNTTSILKRILEALFITGISISTLSPAIAGDKPKLILQITVDQLRGDLPTRYYDRLGKSGLKYLLDKGVVYNNAHHVHANIETIVGHVTLATGAHPSEHGMIGDLWFDRSTAVTSYNIEDANYKLLTEGAAVDASTEIDPTQKAASSDGRSPASNRDGRQSSPTSEPLWLNLTGLNCHLNQYACGRTRFDCAHLL